MNTHSLLSGYKFLFYYEDNIKAGFQKISNIGAKIAVEYLYEGGNHGSGYPIRGAKTPTGKITFEKGVGYLNPLRSEGGFVPGRKIQKPCSIIILDDNEKIQRVFTFDKGIIVSWECSPLDAKNSELLIDKVEIEHTGIYEINR